MTTRCRSSSRQPGSGRSPALRHPGHVRALAIGQTEFAWKLYKACRAQVTGTGNVHFSPLIVHQALTMLYVGSRYGTAELLRTSLCLGSIENDAAVNLAYGDVTRSLAAATTSSGSPSAMTLSGGGGVSSDDAPKPPLEFHVATRIYVPLTHCGLLDQYVTSLRVHYGSDVAKVPFHTDRQRACREINQWVEETTDQTVKELVLTPPSLPTFVSIVLPSAIYFRAAWDKRFASGKAELAPFNNSSVGDGDDVVQVMTFKVRGQFRHGYVDSAACRLLEIPFADGLDSRYSLVLALPVRRLDELETKLDADVLVHLDEHLKRRSKVKVTLPRFGVDDALSLARVLADEPGLGIGAVFARGKVNLSGISGNNNLHLSHVEHKVRFEMDHVRRTKLPKQPKPEAADKKAEVTVAKIKATKENEKKKKNKEASPQPQPQPQPSPPSVVAGAATTNGPPPLPPPPPSPNQHHQMAAPAIANGEQTVDKATTVSVKAEAKSPKKEKKVRIEKSVKQEAKPPPPPPLAPEIEEKRKLELEAKRQHKLQSSTTFEFDRPFFYVVRDRHLGMLLLMGCVRKLSPPSCPVVGDTIHSTSL